MRSRNLVIPSNFVYIYLIEIKLVFLWFFEHNIGLLKIGIEFVMFFLKEYKLCMVKYLSRKSPPHNLMVIVLRLIKHFL